MCFNQTVLVIILSRVPRETLLFALFKMINNYNNNSIEQWWLYGDKGGVTSIS